MCNKNYILMQKYGFLEEPFKFVKISFFSAISYKLNNGPLMPLPTFFNLILGNNHCLGRGLISNPYGRYLGLPNPKYLTKISYNVSTPPPPIPSFLTKG